MTPYQAYRGKKPNLSGLREFGCKVWVHNPDGSKLDGRADIGRWVGFDEESNAHRIYWPSKRSVSVERSVKFNNTDTDVYLPNSVPLGGERVTVSLPKDTEKPAEQPTSSAPPVTDHLGQNFEHPAPNEGRPRRIRTESAAIRRLRAGEGVASHLPRERGELPRGIQEGDEAAQMAELDNEDWEVVNDENVASGMAAAMAEADALEPTYEEAQQRSDWPEWKKAIQVELDNLKAAGTWELVERPRDTNVVDSKWVFRVKKDADGNISKWKARLVARGFMQVYGVDYFETFAPVAKLASIRSILAIAARNDWDISMFDFHSAYLNGELDEDIYMEQPPDYEAADRRCYVVKLHKTLYGLKQAGKKWYDSLCRALADIGFVRSEADSAVFFVHVGTDVIILAIHVDDSTMTGSSVTLQNEFKARINAKFQLTDLGPISWLLGLAITRNRAMRTLSLSQHSYIDTLLRRFNLDDCKTLAQPLDLHVQLSRDQCPTTVEERAAMKAVPYREAVGALNWVAVGTRPDIAFAVSQLAQFMENPGRVHWEAVKRVFRYLKGTRDWKLVYGDDEKRGLEGFTDADGASQEHRRAISGYVILIDGGAVSWSSKKQELVTLSTAEAEYVAATHAAKEVIWFRRILSEIFRPLEHPVILHSDSQSAIALARSQGQFHARTKHIDIRWHFIRYCIDNGSIELRYCPTEDMTADLLTKPLPSGKAKHFAHALGLQPV
jgi:hypothetical protein